MALSSPVRARLIRHPVDCTHSLYRTFMEVLLQTWCWETISHPSAITSGALKYVPWEGGSNAEPHAEGWQEDFSDQWCSEQIPVGSGCPRSHPGASPAKGTHLLLPNQQHPSPFCSLLHSSSHSTGYMFCTIHYTAFIKLILTFHYPHRKLAMAPDLAKKNPPQNKPGKSWAYGKSPAAKAHEKNLGSAPSVPSVPRQEARSCPDREGRPLERALDKSR